MPNLVVIYHGGNWRPAQILGAKVDGKSKVDSELRKGLEIEGVLWGLFHKVSECSGHLG